MAKILPLILNHNSQLFPIASNFRHIHRLPQHGQRVKIPRRFGAHLIANLPHAFGQMIYEMRAETPGNFHALPVLGHAMYVPEIRCNGEEMRVVVEDKK